MVGSVPRDDFDGADEEEYGREKAHGEKRSRRDAEGSSQKTSRDEETEELVTKMAQTLAIHDNDIRAIKGAVFEKVKIRVNSEHGRVLDQANKNWKELYASRREEIEEGVADNKQPNRGRSI